MRLLRSLVGLLMGLACCVAFAQNGPHITVKMRDHGYFMGDIIHQQVIITLASGQTLDENSLPLQGRVTSWLDLRELAVSRRGHAVQLDLVWQIFATVEVAQKLKTPAFVLKTLAKPTVEFTIPQQAFYYSPVFSNPLGETVRRSDLAPVTDDGMKSLMLVLMFGGISLISGVFWLWVNDLIPWIPFNPGPLTQVARTLKVNAKIEIQQQHLKEILHALNLVAGQSLYPNNWETVFKKAPYLLVLKTPITDFFFTAWKVIYGHAPLSSNSPINIEPNEVLSSVDWVQQAALLERLNQRRIVQPAKKASRKSRVKTLG